MLAISKRTVVAAMILLALVVMSTRLRALRTGEAGREQLTSLQGVPPVADAATFAPLASRIDPYVARPRVIVLTDIANEPDDHRGGGLSFARRHDDRTPSRSFRPLLAQDVSPAPEKE